MNVEFHICRVIVSIETYVVWQLYIPRTLIVMFGYLRNKFSRLDNFFEIHVIKIIACQCKGILSRNYFKEYSQSSKYLAELQ